MSSRFIKFIPSEESMYLVIKKPNSFLLLTIIAERARRENGHPDGLTEGQCHLGDWKKCGLTRQEYRTALEVLEKRNHIKKVESNRTRKKSTTGSTTEGTLVELISLTVYDINKESSNHLINHCPTTAQPLPNHKEERRRSIKKEERKDKDRPTPPTSSKKESSSSFFDSLKEIDIPEHKKMELSEQFTEIRVELALRFTQHENFVPTKSVLDTIFWHCRQKNPPEHSDKPKNQWEVLAHKHNEIYAQYRPKAYARNKELIVDQKMMIWQIDKFVSISLANEINTLKNDFELAEKEYKISLKNWLAQEKTIAFENYA